MKNCLLCLLSVLFINSINAGSFQEKNTSLLMQENLLDSLQLELKTPHYRKNILPNDFSYLSELIEFGNNTNQPPTYLRSVVKLFSNLLKGTDYVNAYAFSELINDFPTILAPYFSLHIARTYITDPELIDAHIFDRFQATVNNVLYLKFSTEYDSFKKDPEQFLAYLSQDIVALAQEEVTREQLRQGIIRFCEIALSKLIWNPVEQEKTWHITKKISNQLASLLEHNILDDTNDLDDLYWTLMHRYCYFIDITALDLHSSFYQSVKHEINSQPMTLFALEEQDFIIESKKRHLMRTLVEAEAKSYGYQSGLIRG